ncbi:MAG: hypothetical protein NTW74_04455 [Acidobacteria bacterium]|nr:hypothetical protein [Acidobacteriota bacterium]
MLTLETWLEQATRTLSKDSAQQVRTEIEDHYHAACEKTTPGEALLALGDPKAANRQYRQTLLTSAEATFLRSSKCEAQALCTRPLLKWLSRSAPIAALLAAAVFFWKGQTATAITLLGGGLTMGVFFLAPFLPIYTRERSRIARIVKWTLFTATFALAFGPDPLKNAWLVGACLWPLAWTEWKRATIRRKTYSTQWPKHLYL